VSGTLVDSNVLIDVLTEDPTWYAWSSSALEQAAEESVLFINPLIYAEVAVGFSRVEDLDEALPEAYLVRLPLPWDAAFLAAHCFRRYRRNGGARRSPLPDFYVGSHAAVSGLRLLTRDAARYRTYFPKLQLISP